MGSNLKRQNDYQKIPEKEVPLFIETEIARVKSFENIYGVTYPAATAIILLGTLLFLTLNSSKLNALGLSLIFLGLSTFTIDFFAKERADKYLESLIVEKEKAKKLIS